MVVSVAFSPAVSVTAYCWHRGTCGLGVLSHWVVCKTLLSLLVSFQSVSLCCSDRRSHGVQTWGFGSPQHSHTLVPPSLALPEQRPAVGGSAAEQEARPPGPRSLFLMFLMPHSSLLVLMRTSFNLLTFEREEMRGGEGERFVVPLISAFIGCFLYVPWPGIEPSTLAHRDSAPTSGAPARALARTLVRSRLDVVRCLFFMSG